jgi:hypothetical protein
MIRTRYWETYQKVPGAPHWHFLSCRSFSRTNLKSPCAEQWCILVWPRSSITRAYPWNIMQRLYARICMYIYVYLYICISMYICMYIYLYVYLCAHRMYAVRSRYVFERWQRLMRQLTRATPTSVGDAATSVDAAAEICDEKAVRLPSDLIFEDQLGARHASLLHRCVSLS